MGTPIKINLGQSMYPFITIQELEQKLTNKDIILLGLVAAITYAILDMISPTVTIR